MKIVRQLTGLFSFALSLTILYLSMRAVLGVGGFCAEGGPYVIETHCPKGIAFLTPLSIFAMMAGGALYAFSSVKNSPNWSLFFWTALFVALGWNFLEFGLWQGENGSVEVSWLICSIVFILMGLAPILLIERASWKNMVFGGSFSDSAVFFLGHVLSVAGGIWAGMAVFAYFS